MFEDFRAIVKCRRGDFWSEHVYLIIKSRKPTSYSQVRHDVLAISRYDRRPSWEVMTNVTARRLKKPWRFHKCQETVIESRLDGLVINNWTIQPFVDHVVEGEGFLESLSGRIKYTERKIRELVKKIANGDYSKYLHPDSRRKYDHTRLTQYNRRLDVFYQLQRWLAE